MTRNDRARNLLRAARYEPPALPERRCRECWTWITNPDAVCDACTPETRCNCGMLTCQCNTVEAMRRDTPTYR